MDQFRFRLCDEKFRFFDDDCFTYTSTEQKRVEEACQFQHDRYLNGYLDDPEDEKPRGPVLRRRLHVEFIVRSLGHLSSSYMTMDSSRAWFCYWGMNSLRLLDHKIDSELETKIINFLKACQHPDGGFSGAPGQYPHLATTYASVMALVSIGTDAAYKMINREKLYSFLSSMKDSDGGFTINVGGERDIRGAYCAITVATILNIADKTLFDKTAEWIIGCQTYEGGFGGEHGCEAHGGYTFCGVAGLALLGKSSLINIPSLIKWLTNKQMRYEGGFQGRTNKLVDSCYSFWQAAAFFTIEFELHKNPKLAEQGIQLRGLFDPEALQWYLLVCTQDENGGMMDKPEKRADLYHTCYALSGLAIAQSYTGQEFELIGGERNSLNRVHPLYNVAFEAEKQAKNYFSELPTIKPDV